MRNDEADNRKSGIILRTTVVIIAVIIFLTVVMAFPFVAVFSVFVFVIVMAVMFCAKNIFGINIFNDEIEELDFERNEDMLNALNFANISFPFAFADENGYILTHNKLFEELFGNKNSQNDLKKIFDGFEIGLQHQLIHMQNMSYDIFCNEFDDGVKKIYAIFVVNACERENPKEDIEKNEAAIGLIYIDNYDEVTESVDDVQTPLLTAIVDRKINNYISTFGGILKKFEKDRYLFVITNSALEQAKEKKFEIVETVKETKVGDHIPFTLSIGIGISFKGLDAAMKCARDAIELALGRGGDQVIVKDDEKYQFFGGKSGEVSKNAKIRARVKADALEALINDSSDVFIMGHRMPDYDALGAALGISRIARSLDKTPYIILDFVPRTVTPVYNAILSCEYNNELFISGRKALEIMNDRSLLIVVDTYRPSLVECKSVLESFKKIVVFDHHRKSAEYIENAVLVYHEPYASSTCELVTEVIRHMGDKVQLKPTEADIILSGIVVDTKKFSLRANTITFEAAAYLKRNGADLIKVNEFFRNDIEDFKIRSETVSSAEIYRNGIIIAKCPKTCEGVSIICAQAADELMDISGVRASVVISESGRKIYVSARSLGEVNVQILMEKIGGGGHRTMAGSQFEGIDIDMALKNVKHAIDKYIEEDE